MKKDELIQSSFRKLYNKLAWLNGTIMKDNFENLKSSEIHCIEYIGNDINSNVTKLANEFYMTRGAISKVAKKLIEKNIIESYQKNDNNKEIYFKLTDDGIIIKDLHDKLHNQFRNRDKKVFEQLTKEQVDSIMDFINIYNNHLDEEIDKQNK